MKQNQTTHGQLQAMTKNDTVLVLFPNGMAELPLQNDTEGKIFYSEGKKRVYLPQEWQPRLVLKD